MDYRDEHHPPLELLPAPGQVLCLVPHQVQDGTGHLLLEGPRSAPDTQAAEEGGRQDGVDGGPAAPHPQDPPATHPRSLSKSLGR